jgi:rubrerythrin
MHQQTQENLLTAMRGEAFAYLKYPLFAGQACQDGHADLAALFERTAHVEHFEHFM